MTPIEILATLFTIIMFLTNYNTMRTFLREGTTGTMPILPFLTLTMNGIFWSKYGILLGAPVLIIVNVVGFTIGMSCIFIYHTLCPRPEDSARKILVTTLTIYAVLASMKIFRNPNIATVMGLISCCVSVCMFASPLATMRQVFQKRSAEGLISFPLAVLSVIVCLLWTLYGFFPYNLLVIIPNLLGGLLSVVQVLVCLRFRGPRHIAVKTLHSI